MWIPKLTTCPLTEKKPFQHRIELPTVAEPSRKIMIRAWPNFHMQPWLLHEASAMMQIRHYFIPYEQSKSAKGCTLGRVYLRF